MLEVANKSRAMVLYAEHRFFGASMPFGNPEAAFHRDAKNLGLLSVEQSLEDYAAILRAYKRGDSSTSPTLTFGGSLSGSLAALMRVRHPALVDMAYASSAPVMGYPGLADQYAWRAQVTANWARYGGEDCPQLVRNGFRVVSETFSNNQASLDSLAHAHPGCGGEVPTQADWAKLHGDAWQWLEFYGANSYHPNAHAFMKDACQRMRAVEK